MKACLFKRVAVSTSLIMSLGVPATSMALEAPSIKAQGSVDFRMFKDGEGDYKSDVRTKNVEILISQKLAENIRAVIKLEFERQLIKAGEEVSSEFDLEKAIEAAFIEIKNIGGTPTAIIVGKHVMAYGEKMSKMPIKEDSPLHNLNNEGTMIGVTLKLNKDFFGIFDSVEASLFETEKGDLQIGSVDGASVKLSKKITEKIRVHVSGLHKGNGDNDALEDDDRVGVGVVYNDGTYTAFVEGHGLIHSSQYPDAKFAFQGGVSRELGPGQIAMEASYIDNYLTQLGIGYNLYLTQNVTFGPEIRYTWYDEKQDKEDGFTFGARTTVKFGHPDKHDKTLLK